jgi:general secretion pathway protein N
MRFIKGLLVLLLLLVLVAGALLWTAPASLAYRLAGGRLGPIELQGITGSVWHGQASSVVAMGVALGPGDWRIDRGAALRHAHAEGTISLRGTAVSGTASFQRRGDELVIRDAQARFPAALLSPALDIPALMFTGWVEVKAPHAQALSGFLTQAQGEATWRDVGIAGAAQARLPGIAMTFAPKAGGGISADIRDLGGPLAIAGHVDLNLGAFVLEATLTLREDDPQLAEMLQYVGQRRPDGSSWLRVEGTMAPLW